MKKQDVNSPLVRPHRASGLRVRQVPRAQLRETEANERDVLYRPAKIPLRAVPPTRTLSETRCFTKALSGSKTDRILDFSFFGVGAGEFMAAVQVATIGTLSYTALRDTIFTHSTMTERPNNHVDSVPSRSTAVSTRKLYARESPT
jgi:pyruvate/2-oxoglutarate dehydrogenase complex dihydrolipoamide dehydrogenase (E3) component